MPYAVTAGSCTGLNRCKVDIPSTWGTPTLFSFTTISLSTLQFSSVQPLSCVRLFATPWTAAQQPSLSLTNSRSFSNSCPSSWWCHQHTRFRMRPLRHGDVKATVWTHTASVRLVPGSRQPHSRLCPGPCCLLSTQCRSRLVVPDKTFSVCECLWVLTLVLLPHFHRYWQYYWEKAGFEIKRIGYKNLLLPFLLTLGCPFASGSTFPFL